jgi:stage V sporulation protein SpoVS
MILAMSVTSFGNCVAEAVAAVTRNYPASEIGMT